MGSQNPMNLLNQMGMGQQGGGQDMNPMNFMNMFGGNNPLGGPMAGMNLMGGGLPKKSNINPMDDPELQHLQPRQRIKMMTEQQKKEYMQKMSK